MRYGGDEFVCIIPDHDQSMMLNLQQKITDSLAVLSLSTGIGFPIEASIGFVVAEDPRISLNDYINQADEKMYLAKKARNATRK